VIPRARFRSLVAVPLAAAALAAAAAGCGGSDKPAYCSDRSKLESDIKALPNAITGGVSGLKTQLQTIQSSANALASSAKSDFPSETSAISTSVDSLRSAVDTLPGSPSATQLATVAADATDVVASVKKFSDATSSKCG
jgi:hypothetical protein